VTLSGCFGTERVNALIYNLLSHGGPGSAGGEALPRERRAEKAGTWAGSSASWAMNQTGRSIRFRGAVVPGPEIALPVEADQP